MIQEQETFKIFNYYPSELMPRSNKPILATCDACDKVRITSKHDYHTLCNSCAQKGRDCSDETKAKLSDALKGNINSLGSKRSKEIRELMSKHHADFKGEKHPNWLGGISFEPYCIKFNDKYKNYVRNLFGNECFYVVVQKRITDVNLVYTIRIIINSAAVMKLNVYVYLSVYVVILRRILIEIIGKRLLWRCLSLSKLGYR